MQFLKPEYLFGLLALLIPILVHLFRLRRFQKQSFTNIALLKQIKLQTRRSSTLKKWIILLLRLLAIGCIILAFAQPYRPNAVNNNHPPEIIIFLDNSFSMQAKDQNGPMLTGAIQNIISQQFPTNSVSLFTNTETYRNRSIKELKQDLFDLEYTYQQLDFQSIVAKAKFLFSEDLSSEKYLIVISDFQHQDNKELILNFDSNFKILLVPKSPVSDQNAYIKAMSITPKLDEYTLEIHGGSSNSRYDSIPVSLFNGQRLIGKSILTQSNKLYTTFSLPKNKAIRGQVTIDDPGPEFDNTFYFNLPQQQKIKVLTIGQTPSNYLKRIFTDDEFLYQFSNYNEVNYNSIQQQDLVIINELNQVSNPLISSLDIFTKNGGTVLFVPSEKGTIDQYNRWLIPKQIRFDISTSKSKRLTTINFDHPIFEQAFEREVTNFQYPTIEPFFTINSSAMSLLEFEDNNPFLIERKGFFVFSSPLSSPNTNFTNSPLIVPTLYGIGKTCVKSTQLYYTIGQFNEIDLDYTLKNDAILNLTNAQSSFIPIQGMQNAKLKLSFENNPNKAGHYALSSKTDTVQHLSFNYDKKESQIKANTPIELNLKTTVNSIESAFESVKSEVNIKGLWKWFVIFALIFLIIEMLILKFFR